jgi:hypothetical protein
VLQSAGHNRETTRGALHLHALVLWFDRLLWQESPPRRAESTPLQASLARTRWPAVNGERRFRISAATRRGSHQP